MKAKKTFTGHLNVVNGNLQAWRFFDAILSYYPGYKIQDYKFMSVQEYIKYCRENCCGIVNLRTDLPIIEITLIER